MGQAWFEALRPICKEACLHAGVAPRTDAVLFYLARWCQKRTGTAQPAPEVAMEIGSPEVAGRIVRNLAEDGERVERLGRGQSEELARLRRLLLASARPRAAEAADDYADEALQRISIVLITGTPPSRAAEELTKGPDGPRNEYVFQAPFEPWARRVVINLVIDERRRAAREREGPAPPTPAKAPEPLDSRALKDALEALPELVAAIRRLPPAQCSAMVLSLSRPEVDELVREHLAAADPDLFAPPGADGEQLFASDEEIAKRLVSTSRRVAANRSLARRKLAEHDELWELLLDQLLPHRSTRPGRRDPLAARSADEDPGRR